MPRSSPAATDDVVVVPPGASILDAAAWVGHACWAELRFHAVLTRWLAVEADAELGLTLWSLRSHRAELAESWHRRLPELREFPRSGFVEPGPDGEAGFATLTGLADTADPGERAQALRDALVRMTAHYRTHQDVAIGPADGPTAATLTTAIHATEADVAALDGWLASA